MVQKSQHISGELIQITRRAKSFSAFFGIKVENREQRLLLWRFLPALITIYSSEDDAPFFVELRRLVPFRDNVL